MATTEMSTNEVASAGVDGPRGRTARPAHRDRWRWEDLQQFDDPDDGLRYEVVEGALVVSPSPSPEHQLVAGELFVALRQAVPAGLLVFMAPVDLLLPGGDSLIPDLLVVREDRVGTKAIVGTPELVVEVLSPSRPRYDLVTKRAMYADLGVPRYWVVDPLEPWLLDVDLASGEETRHAGLGPHRLRHPFAVEVTIA